MSAAAGTTGSASGASVLVTSAGRRVGLLECFRRAGQSLELPIRVIACDLDPEMSAACQIADAWFKVPRVDDPSYVDLILEQVVEHGVSLVVPTIDPELRPLAERAADFQRLGCRAHVSPPPIIDIVRDKQETARVLAAAGMPTPQTATYEEVSADPSAWSFPLFMKPVAGSAGRNLSVIETADDLPRTVPEPMVLQELLRGPEFTVNMFIDQDGALKAVVPHRRVRIRAGEVEKGRTERIPELRDLAERIVAALPDLRGVVCYQAIVDETRGAKIIEINARFGGGYPIADYAGAPFAQWLLQEQLGLPRAANDDWREGVLMLRYDAAVFQG